MLLPPMTERCHASMQETRRWYRQKDSLSRAFLLVVEGRIPMQLAEKLANSPLLSAGDKLLERLGDGSLLCLFTAHSKRPLKQVRIQGQISGHVSNSTH